MLIKTVLNGKPAAFNKDQVVMVTDIGKGKTRIRFADNSFIDYTITVDKAVEILSSREGRGLESEEGFDA